MSGIAVITEACIEITPGRTCYELLAGDPLNVFRDGEPVTVAADAPQTRTWLAPAATGPVAAPAGREPSHRGIGADE